MYKSHIEEGNKIILEFDHAGNGLMAKDSELSTFEIAGEDKQYVSAKATIVRNKVEVTGTSVDEHMYVRYGWKDYVAGLLFNKEGLSAAAFSTED